MSIFFQTVLIVLSIEAFLPQLSLECHAADSSFIQTAQFIASDKTTGDHLGAGVAISDNTMIAGAPGVSSSQGAAYAFVQDPVSGAWQEKQKIAASDAAAGDFFGSSVALFGDTAFISARESKTQGGLSGAVYVFVRDGNGTWQQQQKLTASNGDGAAGHLFGASLTLTQDLAVIGAPGNASNIPGGAAYVFVRDQDGQWQQAQQLAASDSKANDQFGCSVTTRDTSIILIGACTNSTQGIAAGAAYLFLQDNDEWKQTRKLTAADGTAGNEFGSAVAFSGNTAFVGARFATGQSGNISGAVYAFTANAAFPNIPTLWTQSQQLFANDGQNGDQFGATLTASADSLLIGAPEVADKGVSSGAVYFFTLQQSGSATWTQVQKFTARDEAAGDEFGAALASTNDLVVVGAPLHSTRVTAADGALTSFNNAGAAYLFSLTSLPASCESKTDYDNAKCSGTFSITSLSDLEDYVAQDFGKSDNNGKYQNLDIAASLTDSQLIFRSPCTITLDSDVKLQGIFVEIDARGGIKGGQGSQISAQKACLLSENNNAGLGKNSVAEVDEMTIQAAKTAAIGKNSSVLIRGDLVIKSTGTSKKSQALIDAGAVVTAGSIHLEAPGKVSFGTRATVAADGVLILLSTGTKSSAFLGNNSQIQATDLTLVAPGSAKIGKGATVGVDDQLHMEATSSVAVAKGTELAVGGNANLTSGSTAQIDSQVVLTVDNEFHVQAAKCKINKKATITAGSTSGNCF